MTKKIIFLFIFFILAYEVPAQWEYVNLKDMPVLSLTFDGNIIYATKRNTQTLYISYDNGNNFDKIQDKKIWMYSGNKIGNSVFFCGHNLIETNDTLKHTDTLLKVPGKWDDGYLTQILVHKNKYYLSSVNGYFFSSTDYGKHWDTISFKSLNKKKNYYIFSILQYKDTVFAAVSDDAIYYTMDESSTWKTQNSSFFKNIIYKICHNYNFLFAVSDVEDNKIGIVRSSDAGKTWELVNTGTFTTLICWDKNILAAAYDGVYISYDNGNHWYDNSYGLVDKKVYNLYKKNNEIWAATNSGIYKIKIDELFTSVAERINTKTNVIITPNPAGDYMEIRGINENVILNGAQRNEESIPYVKVYNVLGECVLSSPVNSVATPSKGGYIRLDVSALVPGVYFVRVGGRMLKFMKM